MNIFGIVALVMFAIFAAWVIGMILAWGLIHGATRTHHREDGPVGIDPHRKQTIHIR